MARQTKAAAQRDHAIRRARERYDLALDRDQYNRLCRTIQEGRGEYKGKQSNRLSVWKLNVPSADSVVVCNVVYDKERHQIVTFLPRGITDAKGVELDDLL